MARKVTIPARSPGKRNVKKTQGSPAKGNTSAAEGSSPNVANGETSEAADSNRGSAPPSAQDPNATPEGNNNNDNGDSVESGHRESPKQVIDLSFEVFEFGPNIFHARVKMLIATIKAFESECTSRLEIHNTIDNLKIVSTSLKPFYATLKPIHANSKILYTRSKTAQS
ncbi:hypothetical protein QQS21_008926 [Conoideocrella luteorostrata]|uniref:Uncharacterized protein n=1 Tax=Conoideocrella luteorostrata TaxID=1105319 RepID=A0AAJ0FQQ9_9HYPO|nr:hypothetical protein QQS21_008926 [Conoideocrella luteorostrata]